MIARAGAGAIVIVIEKEIEIASDNGMGRHSIA